MGFSETYKRVVESYKENLRRRTNDANVSKIGRFLYRPLSFPLTVPFAQVGISANQISVSAIFVFSVAAWLLASGQPSKMQLGAWVYLFFILMDFIDGNLARVFRNATVFGKLLDGFVDAFATLIFIPVAFGMELIPSPFGLTFKTSLFLALFASISFYLNIYFRLRLIYVLRDNDLDKKRSAGSTSSSTKLSMKKVGQAIRKEAVMATPLTLLLCVYIQRLDVFLIFYFLIHGIVGNLEIIATMMKYKSTLDIPTAWARELWKQDRAGEPQRG